MIIFTPGEDIFARRYDAIVNPVNCVGIMGKGLALEFKNRYPKNFKAYHTYCVAELLHPGCLFVTHDPDGPYIINFATKGHWRNPSRISYVQDGVAALADWLHKHPDVRTIAVPKLGCGLGNLDWADVRPVLEQGLADCAHCSVYIIGE